MITVKYKDGKFIVPREEGFIGYEGDNLNVTKEIFVEGVVDMSLVFRMYLMFDDGTCNYFLVDSEVVPNGTLVTWTITDDQIYKDGIVQLQLKASNGSGEVFHSDITTMLVQTSIEFTDFFKEKENSEYLQHQGFLNDLLEKYDKAQQEFSEILEKANADIESKQNELVEFVNQKAEESENNYIRLVEEYDCLTEDFNSLAESADSALKKADEKIATYTASVSDEVVTEGSVNLITSGAVYEEVKDNINYVDMGQVNSVSAFDQMTDYRSIYVFILAKNVISGVTEAQQARCINVGSYQIIALADGRTYARHYSDEAWSAFEKTNMSYSDFENFVADYEIDKTIICDITGQEETFETLKNLRELHKVYYFDLFGSEVNSGQNIAGLTYVNGNTQVIKLVDGSEYIRTFTQKGTTTVWSVLTQVGYNTADLSNYILNKIITTGSGELVPDGVVVKSAEYKYTKIGKMVNMNITAYINETDEEKIGTIAELPFDMGEEMINVRTRSETGVEFFASGIANFVDVYALNNSTLITTYPPYNDAISFSFTFYTED